MNKTTYEQPMDAKLPRERAKMSRSEALATRLVVHHVASVYPVEIHRAGLLASGQPVTGVSWDAIHTMNGDHAKGNDGATKSDALALLASNSAAAGR